MIFLSLPSLAPVTRSPFIALAAAMRRLESVPVLGWPLIQARLLNHSALRSVTDGR